MGPEAMSPRRSPRLMEDLNCNRAARHRVIRARPTVARARKHDHTLGPVAYQTIDSLDLHRNFTCPN